MAQWLGGTPLMRLVDKITLGQGIGSNSTLWAVK